MLTKLKPKVVYNYLLKCSYSVHLPPCPINWDSWLLELFVSSGKVYSVLRRKVAACKDGPLGGTSGGAGSGGDSSFTSVNNLVLMKLTKFQSS